MGAESRLTIVQGQFGPEHNRILTADREPHKESHYETHRTLEKIWDDASFYFDIPEYLREVYRKKGQRVEVLDSGCGIGRLLGQLKQGISEYAIYRREETSPGYGRPVMIGIPADPGLGDMIRTTGVTLSREHAERARELDLEVDEMIIGPLEQHAFDRQYDLIIDYAGAAFYFPHRAMPVYRRILAPDGTLFVKLMFDWEKELAGGNAERARSFKAERLLEENGFKPVVQDWYNFVVKVPGVDLDFPIQKWSGTK